MYNKFLSEKQLSVKKGDMVVICGYRAIVEAVYRGIEKEWNGEKYVDKAGTEYTSIKANFKGDLANWGQYQHRTYGKWTIINDREEWEKYL